MYLVVYTLREPEYVPHHSHSASNRSYWRAFDSEKHANIFYEYITQIPDLYTASICVCFKSTDYPCIKEVVWQST